MTPCPAAAYLPPPRALRDRPRRAPRDSSAQLVLAGVVVLGRSDAVRLVRDLEARLRSERDPLVAQCIAMLLAGAIVKRDAAEQYDWHAQRDAEDRGAL